VLYCRADLTIKENQQYQGFLLSLSAWHDAAGQRSGASTPVRQSTFVYNDLAFKKGNVAFPRNAERCIEGGRISV